MTHARLAVRVVVGAVAVALALATAGCAKTRVVREGEHRAKPVAPRSANRAKPGGSVQVRKGDTLYRIAVDNGVSSLDVAMWNRIPPPYTIYPGQRLRLSPPPERRTPPPRVATTSPAKPSPARPGVPPAASTPKPPAGTKPPMTGSTTNAAAKPPSTPRPTPESAPPPAAPQAAFAWRWPADGALVGRFVAGDPTKQGIDIGGQSGAPVRAAADGVVVYSGAGLVGYGELIIVKHSEQWLSAYGHNRARLVNEGQRVKAGEQIAEMGRSGAARDMLHFEIRYNGKPQDPLQALPKR
ncbi:MAG: LysM peptidoglycan-binding domain-containing protein [Lysobacter sp.]|nr:MAG: LysM peptidoglycan-binding domain-containing protein [Lysobacter sp.]